MKRILQKFQINNAGRIIRGILYLPSAPKTMELQAERFPLILYSHELGKNHKTGIPYADHLAKCGYAVLLFDFCGGSRPGTENLSDGELSAMSVKTECSDLECVLNAAKHLEFIDPKRIALIGASQGGYISAAVAAKRKEEIAALILLFPALVIYDDVHQNFASRQDIPDAFDKWNHWITLGRVYAEDAWDYEPYSHIGDFTGPVLILHGDQDHLVDISYSRKAAAVYSGAEFHIITNGKHGFHGQTFKKAIQYIQHFLDRHISAEYDNTELTTASHCNRIESEACHEWILNQ